MSDDLDDKMQGQGAQREDSPQGAAGHEGPHDDGSGRAVSHEASGPEQDSTDLGRPADMAHSAEDAQEKKQEKLYTSGTVSGAEENFCSCRSKATRCFCRIFFKNFFDGLRVLLSELKWTCLNCLAKWENRQLQKRLLLEEQALGRMVYNEIRKNEQSADDHKVSINENMSLTLKQILFLKEELLKAEEDIAERRKEFVAERKSSFQCRQEVDNDGR